MTIPTGCEDHNGQRLLRAAEFRPHNLTERTVLKAAKAGSRLVLGPRAVMTPLARDRARALGVEIEKES